MRIQKLNVSIIIFFVCFLMLGGCGPKKNLETSILSTTEEVTEEQTEENKSINEPENMNANVSANILSGGELAEENGIIYYANAADDWKLYSEGIGGTAKQKLTDVRADYLNVKDGYIYYRDVANCKIMKMKSDGSEEQWLYEGVIDNLFYYQDNLYFIEEKNNKDYVVRLNCDSNAIKRVCMDSSIHNLIVQNDWIYYYCMTDKMIKKIKIDGSSNSSFYNSDIESFLVDEDWIYIIDREKQKICRIDIDGKNISTIADVCPSRMNIINGWIYYCNGGIWRMRTDGQKNEKLVNGNILRFAITDNALLYVYTEGPKYKEKIGQMLCWDF